MLTITRARSIVEYAENEYSSGKLIEYSFTPFESGGASSPLEALQALYIVIADYFKLSDSSSAKKNFDDYASSSQFVAMSLAMESTEVHSNAKRFSPEIIASIKSFITLDSFVSFLHTLDPISPDYWSKVYTRICLDFPVDSNKNTLQTAKKKPWWRFWCQS